MEYQPGIPSKARVTHARSRDYRQRKGTCARVGEAAICQWIRESCRRRVEGKWSRSAAESPPPKVEIQKRHLPVSESVQPLVRSHHLHSRLPCAAPSICLKRVCPPVDPPTACQSIGGRCYASSRHKDPRPSRRSPSASLSQSSLSVL